MTQVEHEVSDCEEGEDTIKRLSKAEAKLPVNEAPAVQIYKGKKKPAMPIERTRRDVLPLKILASQILSVRKAKELDYYFLKQVVKNNSTPEFSGFNTKQTHEEIKPASKAVYKPLIDMVPSDPTTMRTAMAEAQIITRQSG